MPPTNITAWRLVERLGWDMALSETRALICEAQGWILECRLAAIPIPANWEFLVRYRQAVLCALEAMGQ